MKCIFVSHPKHFIFGAMSGTQTETPCVTGHEPKRIVEDENYRHFTGDGQVVELEDLRVRPLSFHQSTIASTCDSGKRRDALGIGLRWRTTSCSPGFTTAYWGARSCYITAESKHILRLGQIFLGLQHFLGSSKLQMLRSLLLMEPEMICFLKRGLNSWTKNPTWQL